MKKLKKISCVLTSLVIIFTLIQSTGAESEAAARAASEITGDLRAVWVSSVINLDFPSKAGVSPDEMKKETDRIIARAVEIGLNAVVLQVRPCSDALYKSSVFPWSQYLTGVQGAAPAGGFDPLAYWIEKCHANALELHAWINPYRVTHTASKITDVSKLAAQNPARQNPSWVKKYENALYLDPGIPEARNLIIAGAAEIIENYDVDGIHLDDYFYPRPDFPDGDTYAKYGGGLNKSDWRRENVNTLIRGLQAKIKELAPHVRFGVSPFAIWQNKSSDPLGSDTAGDEAHNSKFADTRRWVKEGWVDYICPQIYWSIGNKAADYEKVLNWWVDVCKGTGVDLYIGHAAYKEVEKSTYAWTAGEIIRQLKMNESNGEVKGSIFFRSAYLYGEVGGQIKDYYSRRVSPPGAAVKAASLETGQVSAPKPVTPVPVPVPYPANVTPLKMDKLTVSQPSKDVTVSSAKGYTLFGTSNPGKALTINGNPVTKRTPEGFFSVYVSLTNGANKFTFKQEGQEEVTRVITQKPGSSNPQPPAKAPGVVEVTGTRYAAVTADLAWTYPRQTTSGGSSWVLEKGQKDLVTAKTSDNNWLRLNSGFWIESKNVSFEHENSAVNNVLSNGSYVIGTDTDIIKWTSSAYPAIRADLANGVIDIYFGLQSEIPELNIASFDNTVLSRFTSGFNGKIPFYSFKLKDNARIEGYYTEYSGGEFRFYIKKRKSLAEGGLPLSGFKFVVDAGHGGSDTGALGPMGTVMPEKTVNLNNALKLTERLRALGAQVLPVRTDDVFYELYERTEISRKAMPDMFISTHSNSIAETTDSSNIRGLTVWYKNEASLPAAWRFSENLAKINPGTTRSKVLNSANFYVCRPMWAPSVIIETSFICNIWDFSWMISDQNQNRLADAIVNSVLNYYSP